MRILVLATALVSLLGCAGSTIGYGRGNGDLEGSMTAAVAGDKDDGVTELDVAISLPDPPPVMPGTTSVDLDYLFDIKNMGTSLATIKRINVASAAGTYKLERWSRTFKTTIAPGTSETLTFLARAIDIDSTVGLRGPMTIRAEIEFETAQGVNKAVYVRNVGGRVSVGATKTP